MGMFDTVIVEVPLDGVENPAATEWQTQDFEMPALHKYRIGADGRLWAATYRWVEEPKYPLGGYREVDGWRDTEHHGDLHFYGFVPEWPVGRDLTCFVARFTHGKLEGIKREVEDARDTTGERQP